MKVLNKIILSNIRRFGENVNIEIERGATIFMAPNGTGKTAIFEAIEFALTKAVRRTLSRPEILIRDGKDHCKVRLEFDEGQFIEAALNKDQDPITSGNYQEFYNNASESDIPFLIRLTHLLNQRGADWFVQSDSTEAGYQLDKLSVGRDASMVNGLIISAKRSSTTLIEQKQQEFRAAEQNLISWKLLIDKRAALNFQESDLRVPRKELSNSINRIAHLVTGKEFDFTEDINSLKSHHAAVTSEVRLAIAELGERQVAAETLNTIAAEYPTLVTHFQETAEKLKVALQERESTIKSVEKLRSQIETITSSINDQGSAHSHLQQQNQHFVDLKIKTEKLDKLAIDIDNLTSNLEGQLKTLSEKTEQLRITKELISKYANLRERDQAILQDSIKLQELESRYLQWEKFDREVELLTTDITTVKEERNKLQDTLNSSIEIKDTLQIQLLAAHNTFSNLNDASDIIKRAVNVIIVQIPETQGTCPVCLQEYTPSDLKTRMERALSLMTPELAAAAEQVQNLIGRLSAADKEFLKKSEEIISTTQRLTTAEQSLGFINGQIKDIRIDLSNAATINDARKILNERIKENQTTKSNMSEERNKLAPEPSRDQIIVGQGALNELESQINQFESELKGFKWLEAETRTEIDRLKKVIVGINANTIAEDIIRIQSAIDQLKKDQKTLTEQSVQLTEKDRLLSQVVARLEEEKLKRDRRINEFVGRWKKTITELTIPSEIALENFKASLSNKLSQYEIFKQEVDQIQVELSRWEAASEYFKIDGEIKQLCDGTSEDLHLAALEVDLRNKATSLEDTQNKANTLDLFGIKLTHEIDTVHERVKAINPLWKKLLRRIVIEPRFSDTELNSYTYRRKQHADVNVSLHGNDTLASLVASEAQLTDLQLTFLLAMAQKYQWSPWRALLLDDPTQHHDLVHASAVFDLLRDYISIYNYQVILETHDSMQAKFLMRKLENDGIPSKLYRLINTGDGVNVEDSA